MDHHQPTTPSWHLSFGTHNSRCSLSCGWVAPNPQKLKAAQNIKKKMTTIDNHNKKVLEVRSRIQLKQEKICIGSMWSIESQFPIYNKEDSKFINKN
jgi:hypothetical protein